MCFGGFPYIACRYSAVPVLCMLAIRRALGDTKMTGTLRKLNVPQGLAVVLVLLAFGIVFTTCSGERGRGVCLRGAYLGLVFADQLRII